MSSTSTLFLAYLLTGLTVGLGHCIGMCGPLVVSFSLSLKGRSVVVPHLLYHAGRTMTYMILGAVMGATGSFAIVAANIAVIQKGAMFFAGGLIVVMGLAMTGWVPLGAIFGLRYVPDGMVAAWFRKLNRSGSTAAYFPIGMVLGLLPCGPVYTALIGAARAGMEAASIGQGIITGMLMMFAFGAGTAPALFLIGKLADMGVAAHRDKIYKTGALLMIGVGVYFLISAVRY
jgi:sulfite exporter TauE/SafE